MVGARGGGAGALRTTPADYHPAEAQAMGLIGDVHPDVDTMGVAAAELGAESVAVRLDTQQALANDDDALREARDEHARVIVAAACVGPLVETVLCKDVSEVDAQEYRRAATVLASTLQFRRVLEQVVMGSTRT